MTRETASSSVELRARAKVNLGLAVLARRPDGFHEIDTVLARIEPFDRVVLEPRADGVELRVTGARLDPGPDNLAHRAARVYLAAAEAVGAPVGGVSIRLDKRIPIAAGLGGGSSDAGAVLRGMARLWRAPLDLMALASELGSDVPFFAAGLAAARARGRGERLEPLALPPARLVLVNPGVAVASGDAYRAVERFDPPLDPAAIVTALGAGVAPAWRNGLQPGVVRRHPEVGTVLGALATAGLDGALMSGSGSTCFALARDDVQATSAAATLARAHPRWWVRAVRLA